MDVESLNSQECQLLKACKESVSYPFARHITKRKVLPLIAAGTDVNRTDDQGKTALFYAPQIRNNVSVVRALITAGADANRTDNEGKTALFYAVQHPGNNESVVRVLVGAGADVNRNDHEGKTALFYAVQIGNNESVVRALAKGGADVNITDNEGKTTFFYALRIRNNDSVVGALVDAGADVNRTDDEEKTALFYAVRIIGNNSVLHALVYSDADVNRTDNEGKTALFYAVRIRDNDSMLHALVYSGADVNKTDNEGKTALFYAVLIRDNDIVVHALLYSGADLNRTDNEGKTALFYAVQEWDNDSVVDALVFSGADVNRTDNEGKTALFYAVQEWDNESVLRALIDGGFDVNRTDNEGKTALFYAVRIRNNDSVVHALVKCGADVDITDNEGKTALFYAVRTSNNDSVVHALVKCGADVNRTDNEGKTALFYAVQEWGNESFDALADCDAEVNRTDNEGKTALFYVVGIRNNDGMVHALVNRGADVNITDKEVKTALFYAVRTSNNDSVVRALVNRGADVNITDKEGKTALFYAVQEWGNESVVDALVDCDADVNITDNEGKTALFYAVQEWDNESVVRALVDGGADVNRTDNEGKTALFYAVQEWDNDGVVRALVHGGFDVNKADHEGKTALFFAVQVWNNERVVRVLVDAGTDLKARDHYGRTPLFYAITESDLLTTHLLDRDANLYLNDSYGVLTFLFERLYEIPFGIHERIQILDKKKKVSKEQILKAISSVVFNKILSFNPISYDFDRDPLLELLRIAEHYTTLGDVGQRKTIEKISKRISDKQMEALFHPDTMRIILRNLVELGASPNSVDSGGNSALHHAIQLSWRGVPEENVLYICNQLKEMGASLHLKNHQKETPILHCLVSTIKRISGGSSYQWSEVKTQLCLCQFFLEHGSNVQEKTQNGQSALHLIVELLLQVLLHKELRNRGLEDLLRLFSAMLNGYQGKKVSMDNNGNTPLHLWAKLALPSAEDYSMTTAEGRYTFRGLLSTILNHFKENQMNDVKAKDNNGQTPLHVCRTWTAVELLLDVGANANETDSSGRTPLVVAAENHKSFSIPGHLYPDALQEPKAFWKTAVGEKNLDPWAVDKNGKSVMSILIEAESFDLAQGMIEFACEDNTPDCAKHLFTLLCAVCKDKSNSAQTKTDLVRIILESEKCPLSGRSGEDSPLHFCCRNIVKNPNDHNVHWAITKKLLLYEANCKILDSTGKSCLDIAEECPKLKELLLKPIDINDVPLKIKTWRPISTVHKEKLVYVARGRQSTHVKPYWYHREDLARGSFGAVFAGINEKDGREVAIKRIEKIRMNRPQDKREITNLATLADCEQVVRYLVFFEDEHFSYTVLELMEGHLDQLLDSEIPRNTKVSLCQDVVKGLKYFHDHHILHRDLEPTNILYKTHPKMCLKIADFGLSRSIEITGTTTVYDTNAGTRCWIAPEVLKATKYQHSTASDMFSCGLVLHYILVVKKHPFAPAACANKNAIQISHETESNVRKYSMEGWDDSLCPEATHLLKAMLDKDKKKRPSGGQALDHPFFWTKEKKLDLLTAVGNQPEFECPRDKRTPPLTEVEIDLEARFNTIVKYVDWNDPGYEHMPAIYAEMTKKRRPYDTHSVVELVRFIRNAIAHVSDRRRSTPIRKQILDDFVFLEYFPHLVMEVYKAVNTHGWDQRKEEVKFRHEEIRVCKKR